MAKTLKIDVRLPKDLIEDFRTRVAGTGLTVEQYAQCLLTVQAVELLAQEREDRRRWDERNKQLDARRTSGAEQSQGDKT